MKKSSIFFIIALFFSAVWLLVIVLVPANLSYISSCEPERFEKEFSEDYTIAGQVITRQSILGDELEVEVEIFEESKDTIKHEWIHVKQIENNRIYSCENKILKRVNEIEAYTFSKLPDVIFNKVYGKPKI